MFGLVQTLYGEDSGWSPPRRKGGEDPFPGARITAGRIACFSTEETKSISVWNKTCLNTSAVFILRTPEEFSLLRIVSNIQADGTVALARREFDNDTVLHTEYISTVDGQ